MKPKCSCPVYCKYCGAKLRRDPCGHYCPTKNCQWQYGVDDCIDMDMESTDDVCDGEKESPNEK